MLPKNKVESGVLLVSPMAYLGLKIFQSVMGDNQEANKTDLKAIDYQAAKAKVLQELALAERINSAETIEIEEYYEHDKSAGVGANVTKDSVSTGINMNNSKMTRRVYKISGYNGEIPSVFGSVSEQIEAESKQHTKDNNE